MKRALTLSICITLALACLPAIAFADATVTFDSGAEGWEGPAGGGGSTVIDATGGNPGANLHTVFNDFGITFTNDTNAAFVFDYTTVGSLRLGHDIEVEAIDFFGSPVSRPWLVELRDYDEPEKGFPWTSVWFKFADVSAAEQGNWTRFAVTILDASATALPPGWGGYGAEDAGGNPILPPDRTFASVLAGVDEVAYTTLEPGFVFGFTDHDVRLDNLSIETALEIFADGFESGDTSAWTSVVP